MLHLRAWAPVLGGLPAAPTPRPATHLCSEAADMLVPGCCTRNPIPTALARPAPAGDDIEQRAIAAVFGEVATSGAPPSGGAPLAVSSTKGATGHLLGAAGAVEAIFALLALRHGVAPPTANLTAPDPPLLAGLVAGSPAPLPQGPRAVLSNSFGFGGTNASLVFASPPA